MTTPSTPAKPQSTEELDAQEFETFAQTQDPVELEAATWVTRQHSGLNEEQHAALRAWLQADARHASAFNDMQATYGQLRQLPDNDVNTLRAGLPESEQQRQMRRPTDSKGLSSLAKALNSLQGHALAALLSLAIVLAGALGWQNWQQQLVFEKNYVSLVGQMTTITLPDGGEYGSTIVLDTNTRLRAEIYQDRREVHLQEGQAMFSVKSDPQRPFHVLVDGVRITVVGTRFAVRHTKQGLLSGRTVVAVEEGQVRVQNNSEQTSAAQHLRAGQMLHADAKGLLSQVMPVAPNAVAPWREGRISFDQTPLAQAIAEFERYGHTGLVVRDPTVAALPVGGSYSLAHFQKFAETLPLVLPVRLVQHGEVTEVVAQ